MSDQRRRPITLTLDGHRALILFEWLTRLVDDERVPPLGPAELRVLCDLQCDLAQSLSAPFQADYAAQLEAARRTVGDSDGSAD